MSASYDAQAIATHFDEYGQKEWDRLVKTPVDEVSLHIHTHYLTEYVPLGAITLEIGAGAGRFTQVLANLDARVTVADISKGQLDLNQHYGAQLGFAQAVEAWHQADICKLDEYGDNSFDCVVAYGGPLSYAYDQRDDALAECIRVLKPSGRLILSVMSIWGSAHRALPGVLSLPVATNRQITATGNLSSDVMPGRTDAMHMFRAAELREWLESTGITILALSASNCLSIGWEEELADIKQDPEKWNELLRMELEVCAEECSLGLGTHLIAVARK